MLSKLSAQFNDVNPKLKTLARYANVPSFTSVHSERKSLSKSSRSYLMNRYKSMCQECRAKCTHLQIDHIQPLRFSGTNDISNLQTLCPNCHAEKSLIENKMYSDHVREMKTKISKYWNPESVFYFFNKN